MLIQVIFYSTSPEDILFEKRALLLNILNHRCYSTFVLCRWKNTRSDGDFKWHSQDVQMCGRKNRINNLCKLYQLKRFVCKSSLVTSSFLKYYPATGKMKITSERNHSKSVRTPKVTSWWILSCRYCLYKTINFFFSGNVLFTIDSNKIKPLSEEDGQKLKKKPHKVYKK